MRARTQAVGLVRDGLVEHLGEPPDAEDLAGLMMDGVLGAAVDYQLDADERGLDRRLRTLVGLLRDRSMLAT